MLFANRSQLETLLVQLLTTEPGSSASHLQKLISRQRPTTLQGVYHELGKLQDQNVVIKVGQAFFLNITWANELLNFADTLYEKYFNSTEALSFLVNEKKRQSWKFTSGIRADDFYVHASLALCRAMKCKEIFEWVPHPWFFLVDSEKEKRYQQTLQREKIRIYCAIGGDSSLDRAYLKSKPSRLNIYATGANPFKAPNNQYIQVVGDYIVSLTFTEELTRSIEQTFKETTREARPAFLLSLQQSKVQVRIENAPNKAYKLSQAARKYFGC